MTGRTLRTFLATLTAVAVLASLPQAVLAGPTKMQRCLAAASKAVGHQIDPTDYRIVLVTPPATTGSRPTSTTGSAKATSSSVERAPT